MGWVSARRFGHLSFWSTRSSLPDPGPVVLPFLEGRTIRGPRLAPSLRTRVLGRPEDQLRDNELIPTHSRSPGPQDAQDGAGSGRPSHAPGEWRGRTPAADRLRHNEAGSQTLLSAAPSPLPHSSCRPPRGRPAVWGPDLCVVTRSTPTRGLSCHMSRRGVAGWVSHPCFAGGEPGRRESGWCPEGHTDRESHEAAGPRSLSAHGPPAHGRGAAGPCSCPPWTLRLETAHVFPFQVQGQGSKLSYAG